MKVIRAVWVGERVGARLGCEGKRVRKERTGGLGACEQIA